MKIKQEKKAKSNKGVFKGYARVSLDKQDLTRQIIALKRFGVKPENIYKEKQSGKSQKKRKELQRLLSGLLPGDVVVVEESSRCARNLRDWLSIVEELTRKQAHIVSIKEPYFSTSDDNPHSEFVRNIMMALAQFDVRLISQRTKEGLAIAAAAGRRGGRPPGQSRKPLIKAKKAQTLWSNRNKSEPKIKTIMTICKKLNICISTFYRYKRMKSGIGLNNEH
ncbi:MAG: recombinase family protein [Bacteroidales bacterium]|jgi:DNA invertase Pin-like site-specific DNA recombinase|nr:recombinase family protein [Bacteroidales bacterium]